MLKKIGQKALLVLVSTLVAFLLAESVLRLFAPQETGTVQFAHDPELGAIPVPNQQGRRTRPGVYDYTYSNNSLGLRAEKEYRASKITDLRVLLLGDSFTYGIGVDDNESFAFHLEHLLTMQKRPAEVINAGCGGKGTDYALKFYDVQGKRFQPDVALLCFCPNDYVDNGRMIYFTADNEDRLAVKSLAGSVVAKKMFLSDIPGYQWLVSWSHFANLIKKAAIRTIVDRGVEQAARDGVIHYGESRYTCTRENTRLTKLFLNRLNKEVSKGGGRFAIVYIPCEDDVALYRKSKVLSEPEKRLVQMAADEGIPLFSLTRTMADTEAPLMDLYFAEGHWTAPAHRLAASVMHEALCALIRE